MNEIILEELGVLKKREEQNRQPFKARAYAKVIDQLKEIERPIRTMADLEGVTGIGEKIRAKIEEILKTGKLEAAEKIKAESRNTIQENLMNIYGIGPVKMKELVDMGIRSIADLRDRVKKNPKLLNEKQTIGLQYYEDILLRIPRSEMDDHNEFMRSKLPKTLHMDVVGSYRRGMPDSGDIDVLVGYDERTITEKEAHIGFERFIKELQESGYLIEILASGPKKCMGIVRKGKYARRLDLLLTNPKEYPYALLYFTGSDKFNIGFRRKALEKGYTLNEHGMTPIREGIPVAPVMRKEEDIFRYLEIPYVSAVERQKWKNIVV